MKIPTLALSLCLLPSVWSATWTVDADASRPADFRTLQAANDNASVMDGDTLRVAPGSYPGFTLTKQLSIFGPGYFLDSIGPTTLRQASVGPVVINSVSGALFFGMTFAGGADIRTSTNLTIANSQITGVGFRDNGFGPCSIDIRSCYINLASPNNFFLASASSSLSVTNSIIILSGSGSSSTFFSGGAANISLHAVHNTFAIVDGSPFLPFLSSISGVSLTLSNNLVLGEISSNSDRPTNATLSFNLQVNGDNFADGGTNQEITADLDTVIVNIGRSPDAFYQLVEGSPAANASSDGTDLGAFGGSTPYSIGGLPGGPRIIEFEAPFVVNQDAGLPLRIRAVSDQ